tara:strand:+ start:506 stop:694 length:189 start_codon:yes stop_codon:yes gene_type:complete
MFENCTIKKSKDADGIYTCIKIIYPKFNNTQKIILVPLDEKNTDYQNILQWVADGNTIQGAD